jgi:hypothetical protein
MVSILLTSIYYTVPAYTRNEFVIHSLRVFILIRKVTYTWVIFTFFKWKFYHSEREYPSLQRWDESEHKIDMLLLYVIVSTPETVRHSLEE